MLTDMFSLSLIGSFPLFIPVITVFPISVGKYCPRSKWQPSLRDQYGPRAMFLVQVEATVIIAFIA